MTHTDTAASADRPPRTDRGNGSAIHDAVPDEGAAGDDPIHADADLSSSETAALRRAQKLSTLLDDAVRVPGTDFRIGLDPILGVLPVAGDGVSALLSLYPVAEAVRFGASRRTLGKMLALVGVDAVVGSVPILGGVFDAVWKANEWNVRTLERLLAGE